MAIRWDKFTLKAQEAVQRANELASEGPRIRFAEELGTTKEPSTTKAEPKKKKSKKDERPETEVKAATKKAPKRGRRYALQPAAPGQPLIRKRTRGLR